MGMRRSEGHGYVKTSLAKGGVWKTVVSYAAYAIKNGCVGD